MADLERPRSVRCARCGRRIKVSPTGRLPVYCNTTNCRQMAYAKRKRAATKLPPPLTDDERHRLMLWQALKDFGLVKGDMPPKPKQEDQT
jgi:hypothetical protein